MSLDLLAREIVRLSVHGGTTPVLVTPSYLSFRPEFFRQFVSAVASRTDRTVRIDWLRTGRGISAVIGDRMAARQAAKITRMLRGDTPASHSIELSSSIGRPDGSSSRARSELVIGLCDNRQPLPPWATAISLGDNSIPSADQ
ncbi:hypothetical protein Poly51_03340 [Rubripirellula tenax]|uniref:Uncharacterized protein n=2 Tax=Rubripirellula tenax TaxID=2528015 RepID=A0A5C6FGT6_9BACT|nr:hypothetical protein Poly51_03340 [Rubripirellula tenax]